MAELLRVRGRAVAGVLALVLLACAGPAPAPDALSPTLWRARAAHEGTFYLLGSVHLGTDSERDFGPAVTRAWRNADELVVEVDPTEVDPDEVVSLRELYGTLPRQLTLRDVLTGETWGQLDAYLQLRGVDGSSIQRRKPWFVSQLVVQIEFLRAGYRAEHGVDLAFIDAARGHKPIVALETVALQVEMFDRLPASLQELMLRDALARTDSLSADMAEMVDAWQTGDDRRLEQLVFQPLDEFPELEVFYDLVFFQRNQTMATRLAQLGEDGRTRFVVVGAGHMVGEQGIPALLAQKGYDVTRVR